MQPVDHWKKLVPLWDLEIPCKFVWVPYLTTKIWISTFARTAWDWRDRSADWGAIWVSVGWKIYICLGVIGITSSLVSKYLHTIFRNGLRVCVKLLLVCGCTSTTWFGVAFEQHNNNNNNITPFALAMEDCLRCMGVCTRLGMLQYIIFPLSEAQKWCCWFRLSENKHCCRPTSNPPSVSSIFSSERDDLLESTGVESGLRSSMCHITMFCKSAYGALLVHRMSCEVRDLEQAVIKTSSTWDCWNLHQTELSDAP